MRKINPILDGFFCCFIKDRGKVRWLIVYRHLSIMFAHYRQNKLILKRIAILFSAVMFDHPAARYCDEPCSDDLIVG